MKKNLMRILCAAIALIMAAAVMTSCKKDENAPPDGMKEAFTETSSFRFYVPERWTVEFSEGIPGAYYSTSDPSSVSVAAWELVHTDDTVDTWWEQNVSDLSMVMKDFELVKTENLTVDGVYAKAYIYTASLGEMNYKFEQVACVKNTVVYLFTYTSLADNFDKHAEDVAKMLENWKLN